MTDTDPTRGHLYAADPRATAKRVDRRTCATCEATPRGCASNHWLRGRWCCERCPGDHDGGDDAPTYEQLGLGLQRPPAILDAPWQPCDADERVRAAVAVDGR